MNKMEPLAFIYNIAASDILGARDTFGAVVVRRKAFRKKLLRMFRLFLSGEDKYTVICALTGRHESVLFMPNGTLIPAQNRVVSRYMNPQNPVLHSRLKNFLWEGFCHYMSWNIRSRGIPYCFSELSKRNNG